MEPLIIFILTLLVGIFVGYLTGYAKKKGENLATHEDIGKLTDQVAAVTKTAKEIEAKISSDVWDRQKRWEMKREVLFEATKRLAEVDLALSMFDVVLQVETAREDKNAPDLVAELNKYALRWHTASAAFDETRLFVDAICEPETKQAFDAFRWVTVEVAAKISKKDKDVYDKSRAELTKRRLAVAAAVRKELGVDSLAQPPAELVQS